MPDTRCTICRAATSTSGAPTTLVALTDGQPVYACDEHASELAAPPGDVAVALAQLADVYRRLYRNSP
ncbi:hypothetical protein [Streptomyces sp. NPDC094049]|uniref:hypothetical protein n=1 Tax=Streptomyces sp. NPDC094049 TaxID=3154987 RepID=UPI00332A1333